MFLYASLMISLPESSPLSDFMILRLLFKASAAFAALLLTVVSFCGDLTDELAKRDKGLEVFLQQV